MYCTVCTMHSRTRTLYWHAFYPYNTGTCFIFCTKQNYRSTEQILRCVYEFSKETDLVIEEWKKLLHICTAQYSTCREMKYTFAYHIHHRRPYFVWESTCWYTKYSQLRPPAFGVTNSRFFSLFAGFSFSIFPPHSNSALPFPKLKLCFPFQTRLLASKNGGLRWKKIGLTSPVQKESSFPYLSF